jgi:hypothetical protein
MALAALVTALGAAFGVHETTIYRRLSAAL